MPVAFITGITGQDGSYLAELLLEKGYTLYGMKRRHSFLNTSRIDSLLSRIHMFYGDMNDAISIMHILSTIKEKHVPFTEPFEIYNLAAQSHVQISFQVPEYTAESDALGPLRLMEAIRSLKLEKVARLYQASTSEMFGLVQETPQKETTPFYPRSPYGVAKLYGHWIVKNYREAYGLYACSGILFNHESPRRGQNFVTRKITPGIAKIVHGSKAPIVLGNIDALRDWGHAKEYVEGMWRMLQRSIPEDFILATGTQHSVREFLILAFAAAGFTLRWEGSNETETAYDVTTNQLLVRISPEYYRPAEVESLLGDASKAKKELGWEPVCPFEELVKEMVKYDIKHYKEI